MTVNEFKTEICDHYCRFVYEYKTLEKLEAEKCQDCPVNNLNGNFTSREADFCENAYNNGAERGFAKGFAEGYSQGAERSAKKIEELQRVIFKYGEGK